MHRIIFSIGPFTVYSYGFFVALGAAMSVTLAAARAKKEGVASSDILDIMAVIILGALLGGRLLFVAVNWQYYAARPIAVFNLTEGGLAFQGALVAGLLAGALVSRLKKISFWKVGDIISPYLALAHSVGRIGCFFNGCCYGKPALSGLAVTFPGDTLPRVPAQLYSSAGLLGIFILLLVLREKPRFEGYLFSVYIMLYAVFRVFMDRFRGDDLATLGGVTISVIISIALFAAGALLYFLLKRRDSVKGSDHAKLGA